MVSRKCACGKAQPIFAEPGAERPSHCATCKLPGMVNVKSKRCPLCSNHVDSRVGSPKYDGHCATCFKRAFPDDQRSTRIYEHSKEIRVRNFINQHFLGFVHDIMLPMWVGCDCEHRRRVDHRRLIGNVMLAVETDENAHRYYDPNDERIRYDDLFMAHSGPWIFIRFNPDNNFSGKGIDLEDKLERLREVLDFHLHRIESGQFPSEGGDPVEIHKLFI